MITVENLTKSFHHDNQTSLALDDVSMDVPAGSIFGVFGAAGAGKSTLTRCVSLRETPDHGTIKLNGTEVEPSGGMTSRVARKEIALVPRAEQLNRQRTVAGNVGIPLESSRLSGQQRRGKVAELLDLVGLTDRATLFPDQLSGAQRQRVAIARTLATKPSVLVADEPTASAESGAAESVLTVLDRARSELGTTVLITTEDDAVVRRVADQVAVLQQGRVVESGNVLDLATDPASLVSSELFPDLDQTRNGRGGRDVVADVVLVGFAAVGALLPEASNRFGVDVSILGGGLTRLGDTPVGKFRVSLAGDHAETALKWMVEHDARVRRAPTAVGSVAA